jgi:hypothetical protein
MRPRIPWGRLGAEGAVIVASILLAFAVQAWWEGRQEQRQETEYLTALREELNEGLARLPQTETAFRETLYAHEALVGQFRETARAPTDSLTYWLSRLSWPPNFTPPTAVLNDLVSSGGIQLIKADPIRLGVAEYTGWLTRFEDSADQAWATWSERLQPYLEGRVPRVARLRQGGYPRPVPFGPSPFVASYEDMFGDAAFESMVAERWARLDAGSNVLGQIRSVMTELVTLIDQELGTG